MGRYRTGRKSGNKCHIVFVKIRKKITDTYMKILPPPKSNVKHNFVIKQSKINLVHLAKILAFPFFH